VGDLPKGRTCLGVKTPEDSTNPPPWVGTRFGDPSKYQLTHIPGGFHAGWDVWEIEGAPITSPRRGRVIESRDINQVSTDFNMCVQVELTVPSRLKPGTTVKVYMQVLHVKAHTMARQGKSVERGETIGRVGFFGMARIGNPHAHVEFFWSKAAALAYNHALAVDPYFIRRHYLNEDSPLVRVPERFRWWNDRLRRPNSDHSIKPRGNEPARMGVLAAEPHPQFAVAAVEEGEVEYACGTGEPDEGAFAAEGLEPVYFGNGELDIERMITEQEGMTLEEATYQEDE
jgi:hypothetical protein